MTEILPLDVDAFEDTTAGWPPDEVGAYLRLLMYSWRHGAIPADRKSIATVVRCSDATAFRLWHRLSAKFPQSEDGCRRNPRLERTRREVAENAAQLLLNLDQDLEDLDLNLGSKNVRTEEIRSSHGTEDCTVSTMRTMHASLHRPNPIRYLLSVFCRLHRERLGVPYAVMHGKDGALLKWLLQTHEADKIAHLMETFFDTGDEFIQRTAYTIGIFISSVPKLIAHMNADRLPPQDPPVGRKLTAAQITLRTMRGDDDEN